MAHIFTRDELIALLAKCPEGGGVCASCGDTFTKEQLKKGEEPEFTSCECDNDD